MNEVVTHATVVSQTQNDACPVSRDPWNHAHTRTVTERTVSSDVTVATDAGTGEITDGILHCSGTMTVYLPNAIGDKKDLWICCDAGTVAVTVTRSGSQTINGVNGNMVLTAPGDNIVICSPAAGKWSAIRNVLQGDSALPTTPLALSAAGSSPYVSRIDHAHRSPGVIAVITSQTAVGPSSNSEVELMSATLPTNFLAVGTTFRFQFRGTVRLQATSGNLTFKMYIGANAGQTVQLASVTSAQSEVGCEFEGIATVRSTGASGTFLSTGSFYLITSATAMRDAIQGGASTSVVDTTAATPTVRLTAQFATSSTTNFVYAQTGTIEIIKM
jgi:hypothetical protein